MRNLKKKLRNEKTIYQLLIVLLCAFLTAYPLIFIEILLDNRESHFEFGYIEGLRDQQTNKETLRNPSYEEALGFLFLDKTDEKKWSDNYDCFNFARDLRNNAFNHNYSCGFVLIELQTGISHAIVCFNTTDNGLIFVEPQTDEVIVLIIGQRYKALPKNDERLVTKFEIFW